MKFWFIYHGALFTAFGLGVVLEQSIELASGYWFLGLGFLFLIIQLFMPEVRK